MTEKEHDVDYADPEEEQKIAPVSINYSLTSYLDWPPQGWEEDWRRDWRVHLQATLQALQI